MTLLSALVVLASDKDLLGELSSISIICHLPAYRICTTCELH